MNYVRYIYWLISIILLWFAFFSFDKNSYYWSLVGVVLYCIPIVWMLFHINFFRYYVFCFSIFLAVQSAIPSLFRFSYYVSQPNSQHTIIYEPNAIPGFSAGPHKITIDRMGYRTTKHIEYNKPANGIRIFTIGGSTTQMIDIDDHRTWSHHLQEKLSNELGGEFEVINTGVAGIRAEQNLATLKKITKYHPNIAIFLIGVNDWRRHTINHILGVKNNAGYYPWENFSLKNSIIGRISRSILEKRKRAREDSGLTSVNTIVFKANPNKEVEALENCGKGTTVSLPENFPESVSQSFSESLERIYKVCEGQKLTCILLTQPHGYKPEAKGNFRRDLSCNNRWAAPYIPLPNGVSLVLRDIKQMGRVAEFYNNYTIDFAHKKNMYVCDLASKIEASYRMFYDEVHFTEMGTMKVADEVFACIRDTVEKMRTMMENRLYQPVADKTKRTK